MENIIDEKRKTESKDIPVEDIHLFTHGLVVISEIDSELRVIDRFDSELRSFLNSHEPDPSYLRGLIRRTTTVYEWQSDERREQAQRFSKLFDWMKKSFGQINLVRKGNHQATVFVFGKSTDEIVGFEFDVLET